MTRQMVVVWMTVLSLGVLADVATPKSRVSESVGADLVLTAKGEVVSVRGGAVDQVSAGKADDGNYPAGLDFLSRQVKGRPADFTLPATGKGGEEALGKSHHLTRRAVASTVRRAAVASTECEASATRIDM